jgi:pimeloyl-ACP methyl ester carboxylesterase
VRRPLCHALDWLAIQVACRSPQRGVVLPEEHGRIANLLAHPDFFSGNMAPLGEIHFQSEHHFSFPSPLPCPWAQNNTVPGRLYRSGQDWAKRPIVLLLHGWNGELNYETLFPWMGRRLAAQGITAMSLLLPYHGSRKPREPGAIRNFICDDVGAVLAAARQSIADCRALIGWLHAQGCPHVGVFGLSFGGWLTGLLSCHEPLLSYAILGTPINRMDRALRELPFCLPLKEKLEHHQLKVDSFDLVSQKPILSPDRTLLLESQHDLFAPAETIEELWLSWNKPEIWRVPHGHISVLFSTRVMGQICQWIAYQSGIEKSRPKALCS